MVEIETETVTTTADTEVLVEVDSDSIEPAETIQESVETPDTSSVDDLIPPEPEVQPDAEYEDSNAESPQETDEENSGEEANHG